MLCMWFFFKIYIFCKFYGNFGLSRFGFVHAGNYLHIKNVFDLTCQGVVNIMKGMTPEEIRKSFNIKNDFNHEEEEEIKSQNQSTFK